MKETSLEDLDLSVFAELVNSSFFVRRDPSGPIELVLVEARPLREGGEASEPARSFSLIFQGSDQAFLPQSTHAFEHERTGRFALFIVPVGQKPGVFEYQAVINRTI